MKSILVFLAIISATFAWRSYAQEKRWLPKSFLSILPWDITKYYDFNMEANVQWDSSKQDVFKAGQTYFILGKNKKFLCASGNTIKASGKKPADNCRFIASVIENGKVSLQQRDAMGNYVCLQGDTIMSNAPAITVSAQFIVEVSSIGRWTGTHYVYLKAENGKYWGQDSNDKIEATSCTKETVNRMIVMEVL